MAESPPSETQLDIELYYTRANDFFREFSKDGSRNTLESAIENADIVVCHAPKGSTKYLKMAWMLAHLVSQRGDVQDGVPVDLERSVCLFNTWLEEAPDSHFERPFVCCLLAGVLKDRFGYSKNREDLEEALRLAYKAVERSDLDPTYHLMYLRTVQEQLESIYKSFDELEVLDRLILARRHVLEESTKRDDPERWRDMDDLERGLYQRFEKTGNIADLQEALPLAKAVLLDEAIEAYRTALASTYLSNDDRAMISSNLAIALQARYETSGAAEDIEEAVSKARDSVSWTAAQSNQRAVRLNGLGTSLSCLYNRFERLENLNEAIDCAREAVKCASRGSDHGMYLSNLSTKLSRRYNSTHSDEDRSESVMLARKAVEVTPKSEWMRYATYTHNLATRIYEEYLSTVELEPNVGKLEEAISWSRIAFDCTPKTHTDWSDYAYWLGWRQMALATCATDVEKGWALFDEGIETLKEASMPESASPMQRLRAARAAALMLMCRERWAEANELSTKTVALLSHVSPRSMMRQDMQFRLSGLSNLSTFAAVASLNSGSGPEEALALLEMGRGLIFGFLIGNRADVSDLGSINPDISSQYDEIREQLTQISISSSIRGDVVHHRQELTKRLTTLEDQIRELPGLSRFQLPASGDELKELASEGPLVSFNVTKFRSDAFIVTSKSIIVLPLPALHEVDLQTNVRKIIGKSRLTKCTLVQRNTSNKHLAKILIWLWEVAVKPVMNYLGLTGATSSTASDLPRLWWVTSGLMGLMPLHAAGSGWDESLENTASRCVSSYVHTMKALAHSRSRAKQPNRTVPDRVLAVHTPQMNEEGWADLNTAPEMAAITTAASRAGLPCAVLESPTVSSVIDEMRRSPIVHFACHGDPSFDDPSQTSLVLRADTTTPDGHMTVDQLFDETHQHAQLAYLSACCTAQQYDEGLIDEGIHLGSVFQLMGFPAVVATLWEADDGAATEVAGAFYRRLLGRSGGRLGEMEDGRVARCLHDAMAELRGKRLGRRKRKAEDVLAWAPFVHVGI
ncbi:Tetratricopeptide-like helical protein [Lasiodiplodia theobromae]|uniref:Tetratricopeptide-like helical protein n=1 Tax=Lasiodiplodia theobromae TaxID=45133 RepID=A0A8H7IRA0_9PEZI|nr:Tetratricopeptide-like helical protein [Lasiodiplodia theobromae]